MGRKEVNAVHKCFKYDSTRNKSMCLINECGCEIAVRFFYLGKSKFVSIRILLYDLYFRNFRENTAPIC